MRAVLFFPDLSGLVLDRYCLNPELSSLLVIALSLNTPSKDVLFFRLSVKE